MAIELPVRSGAGGSRRRAGQLPSAENVPQVGIARDPGVQVPQGAFDSGAAEFAGQIERVSDHLLEANRRIQNREDTISSAILSDEFEQGTLASYNSTLEAGNILDPKKNTIGTFNAETKQRIQETVAKFSGSDDARAKLEASLIARSGQYANQMITFQNTEQRKYISERARNENAPIAARVANDPSTLRSAFAESDRISEKYADSLDPATQRRVRDANRSDVMEGAITGLINRGAWKQANAMLLDNPILMRYLDPSKKDQFNRQIANFAQADNKSRIEMAGREATVARLVSQGVKIDPNKAVNFVVGADIAETDGPGEKVNKGLAALGIRQEDATVEQKAAILKIDLPKAEAPDPNKDFKTAPTPDGGRQSVLTEQGAFKRTQPYIVSAVDMSTKVNTVENAYKGYLDGNELEGLTVLQTYLKMIDEGAVVRDSDIALAERASPIYETIKAAVSRYGKEGAQAVTRTVVDQAQKAAKSFGQKALEMSKGFFDGYEKETGYPRGVLGLPGDRYDVLFGNVRTVPNIGPDKKGDPVSRRPAANNEPDEPGTTTVTRNPDGTLKIGR